MQSLWRLYASVRGRIERTPLPVACAGIFLVSFLVRGLLAFLIKPDFTGDTAEVQAVAKALVLKGMFADPYKIPTGPTALVPPAFPFLLAGIYKMLGIGPSAEMLRQAICIAVTSLQFALLPALASAAGIPLVAGVAAGLLGALLPIRYWVETFCAFGEPCYGLGLLVCAIMTVRAWRTGALSLTAAAILGIAWGATMLFTPSVLLVMIGTLACGFCFVEKRNRRRYALSCLVALGVLALVLAPWTIRNYRTFGGFMLVRSNLGLELFISNCELSYPDTDQNIHLGVFKAIHPVANAQEAAKLQEMGEIAYNRLKLRQALDWISANRARFLALTWQRFVLFWSPSTTRRIYVAVDAAIVLCALAGFVPLWRRHRELAVLSAVILLVYPTFYYFIQATSRYRYPIDWMVYFLAAFLVSAVLGHFEESARASGRGD